MFRLAQVGSIGSPYRLIYDRTLNLGYEPSYQAYANYLASPGKFPALNHMWVNYRLDEVTGSGVNQLDWGAVKFLPGTGPAAAASFFQSANSVLQVNKTYRVTRSYFYQDVNHQNLDPANIYGDPSCKALGFEFRISLNPFKVRGRTISPATVTYSMDGKVVRTAPVEISTDGVRSPRD